MNCPACQNQQAMQGVSGGAILGGMALLLIALFGYAIASRGPGG